MRVFSLLLALLLVAGCGTDPVTPGKDTLDPEVWFEGSYDGTGFVLQRTEVFGPGGVLITLELFASRLQYDASAGRLNALVHVRNTSQTELYAPARVGLGDFNPPSVQPLNANSHELDAGRWWYDYSHALGEDDILSAGETSDGVLWILQLPEPGSFSFAAVARFAAQADRAVLAGRVFLDENRDGVEDPEEPRAFGEVEVTFPQGRRLLVTPDEQGRWAVPAETAGIYSARWISPPTLFGFAPVCLTTPNPLQVLMTPGPDGLPNSFRDADFGIDPLPCTPWRMMPIVVSHAPIDSVESDPWAFVDLVRSPPGAPGPERLDITLGFGGCSANHPLVFVFADPGDATVAEPTMVATIYHDDMGELCDAWFQVTQSVDLDQLRAMWMELTGQVGPLRLELHTPQGIEPFQLD